MPATISHIQRPSGLTWPTSCSNGAGRADCIRNVRAHATLPLERQVIAAFSQKRIMAEPDGKRYVAMVR
jgi:hypothetical protein